MLNQVVLVGILAEEVKKGEGKDVAMITLVVPRSYKNKDGEYVNDYISTVLQGPIATNTAEFCHKGDIIGIKGRLQSNENKIELVAEKVTFLSSKKGEE